MPTTLLTLPRELRDQICEYVASSCSFAFLFTCHQLNVEGTALLYRYGVYRVRALTHPNEHVPFFRKPPPTSISRIQNIHISMPKRPEPDWEMSLRAERLLSRFAGTVIERQVCHVNLYHCTFCQSLERLLCSFQGFAVVRVEHKTITFGLWERFRRANSDELVNESRRGFWRVMEESLGPATFRDIIDESGMPPIDTTVVEFRPRHLKK